MKLTNTINFRLAFLLVIAICCGPLAQAQIITTFAGSDSAGFAGDGGPATLARLSNSFCAAFDASGNAYIADFWNNRIRKVNTSGIITTIAGTGATGYAGDGGPASAAMLHYPYGIVVDAGGNVYFADNWNYSIRKINTSGIITTIAGTGTMGGGPDGSVATATSLGPLEGIGLDGSGNIHFIEGNKVRKISASGTIVTVAGVTANGFAGDGGPATAAKLNYPTGLAFDAAGNMYIGDDVNSRIRKVNTSGIISTIAGNGHYAFSGDGGPATAAELNGVAGLLVDAYGSIYIGDYGNQCIRKITPSGIMTTVAGDTVAGFSGDGGPATAARFQSPGNPVADPAGNLYVCDARNFRVRKITRDYTLVSTANQPVQAASHISPNPSKGTFTFILPYPVNEAAQIVITNALGQKVKELAAATNQAVEVQLHMTAGMYYVSALVGGRVITEKLVVE
jgi:hypothetical protein